MLMGYAEFIQGKTKLFQPCGFDPFAINQKLFDFQQAIVRWGIRKGRAAFFEDCGLGKTAQQLEWAAHVARHTGNPVLIFAPLAVTEQTVEEGVKFSVPVRFVAEQSEIRKGVNITNYEKLDRFTPDILGGIVLDESSILKGFDGATRKRITEFASTIPYRLCCTATPAPNDYMELGNHAEFLGVMTLPEMLATFFVHDGGDTAKWRLKRHAEKDFWKWLCSWAVAVRKPSDLGFDDGAFTLPPLHIHQLTTPAVMIEDGLLFPIEAKTLAERRQARKGSIDARVDATKVIIGDSPDQWMIWCNLNAESEALADAIVGAVEVTGSDPDKHKKDAALAFARGEIGRMVSKSLIFGYGMNFQISHKMVVMGLSDSWEQFYQLVRRQWRFGQKHPVDCYVVVSESEGEVVRNIERKEAQAKKLMDGMVNAMMDEMRHEVVGANHASAPLERVVEKSEKWTMAKNDCVEELRLMADESIDYSIFSPPFASLYTYSNSERDMGNCASHEEFYQHMRYLVPELFRVLKSGRLVSFHCMNLPKSKERDGVIGIWDFRGSLIRLFEEFGFVFHSEVCIWKDPVTAMQRTKAIGLLYKQLRKDSALSRQGIPDYLVTMRKPGLNLTPVTKTHESFPVDLWQRYASPVWMDINPSDTLQKESAREQEDERHICPLQLQVIQRGIELWTNPGDVVFSPFAGIGSEGYVALQNDRRFYGVELKDSYYRQAVLNLKAAHAKQQGLFSDLMGTAMRDADEAAERHMEEQNA
jgi:DNA modification methylase